MILRRTFPRRLRRLRIPIPCRRGRFQQPNWFRRSPHTGRRMAVTVDHTDEVVDDFAVARGAKCDKGLPLVEPSHGGLAGNPVKTVKVETRKVKREKCKVKSALKRET